MAEPTNPGFASVDDYIAALPEDVQPILAEVRKTIAAAVPEGTEAISYQIPTFKLRGKNLVHFAAWARHVGVYPVHTVHGDLERELEPYRTSKATVRFPLDEPMPLDLIRRLAEFLAAQRS